MGSGFSFDEELQWADGETTNNATFTATSLRIGYHENFCCLLLVDSATIGQAFTVNIYDGTGTATFETTPIAMYTFTRASVTGITGGDPIVLKVPFTMSEGRPWIRTTVTAPAGGTIVYDGYYGENNTQIMIDQYNV